MASVYATLAVMVDNDSHYATYYFNHHWLAGGSLRDARGVFTHFTDYPLYSARRVVFLTLIAALSPLAALPLVVWRLFAFLAETQSDAGRRETACHCGDFNHIRPLAVDGKNDVGTNLASDYPFLSAHIYVATAGG
jgi:hypothetical protein